VEELANETLLYNILQNSQKFSKIFCPQLGENVVLKKNIWHCVCGDSAVIKALELGKVVIVHPVYEYS
jgi:hypothetical protein